MPVIMPDGFYVVRRRVRPSHRDAHGLPVPGAAASDSPEVEGATVKQRDGRWNVRLGSAVWPVRAGDIIVRPIDGTQWTVYGQPRLFDMDPFNSVSLSAMLLEPDPDRGHPA